MIFHTLLLFRQFIVGGCYDGTIYCNPHVGAEFINGIIPVAGTILHEVGHTNEYNCNFANYYPFGMQQTGTAGSYDLSSDYRYGFNGKEKDNEIKGEANSLDYGARIYDPRVGKFLSTDPLQLQFPFMSPFIYAADDPIRMIDEDGKGPKDRVWFAMKYYGIPYKQEGGNLRTQSTEAALEYMDCSELVSRVLKEDNLSGSGNVATLVKHFEDKNSNWEEITDGNIKAGDIITWTDKSNDHTGVVITDAKEKFIWVMDAHTDGNDKDIKFDDKGNPIMLVDYRYPTPAMPSKHFTDEDTKHHGSPRFWRPKKDTPDDNQNFPIFEDAVERLKPGPNATKVNEQKKNNDEKPYAPGKTRKTIKVKDDE